MLQCLSLGLTIKNCDLPPIEYLNPKTKTIKKYYPDFIVGGFLIIEVKWIGFVYEKKKEEIRAKRKALELFCENSGRYASLFATNNMIKKKWLEAARRVHKEINGEQ